PLIRGIREHAERGAGILSVNDIEESGNDGNHIPRIKRRADVELGDSINQNHRRGNAGGNDPRPHAHSSSRISFRASEHESQTVGNSASSPTAREYFQQRSHFSPAAFSTVARRISPGSRTTSETMNSEARSVSNPL